MFPLYGAFFVCIAFARESQVSFVSSRVTADSPAPLSASSSDCLFGLLLLVTSSSFLEKKKKAEQSIFLGGMVWWWWWWWSPRLCRCELAPLSAKLRVFSYSQMEKKQSATKGNGSKMAATAAQNGLPTTTKERERERDNWHTAWLNTCPKLRDKSCDQCRLTLTRTG